MILIYVPCKNSAEAKKIALQLVKEKLIACANIVPKINSIYFWQGKIQKDSEALLLCKTKNENRKIVVSKIKNLHSYKVPFIGCLKFDSVNDEYLNWAKGVIK